MTQEHFPDRPNIGAALSQTKAARRDAKEVIRQGMNRSHRHGGAEDFAYFDAWVAHRKKTARSWLRFTDLYHF